jgi:hypothetical protein
MTGCCCRHLVGRIGFRVVNVIMRLARRAFRVHLHRTSAVDAVVRGHGLTPKLAVRAGPVWQVALYTRQGARRSAPAGAEA